MLWAEVLPNTLPIVPIRKHSVTRKRGDAVQQALGTQPLSGKQQPQTDTQKHDIHEYCCSEINHVTLISYEMYANRQQQRYPSQHITIDAEYHFVRMVELPPVDEMGTISRQQSWNRAPSWATDSASFLWHQRKQNQSRNGPRHHDDVFAAHGHLMFPIWNRQRY